MTDVYKKYNIQNESDIIWAFDGDSNDPQFRSAFSKMSTKLEHKTDSKRLKHKVFKITIEVVQNVYKNVDCIDKYPDDINIQHVQLLIWRDNISYHILTHNYLNLINVSGLEKQLLEINSKDNNELKALFAQKLGSTKIDNKGGAGLGLIEIALISEQKLDFEFEKVSANYSLFRFHVIIDKAT